MKRTSIRTRGGVILLFVLGVLALLSVLALSFMSMSNMERSIAQNYIDHTRAQLASESGVEKALAFLKEYHGVLDPVRVQDILYNPADPAASLRQATLPSCAIDVDGDGSLDDASGVVGGSYCENGDIYRLRIQDQSALLNVNLGPWTRGTASPATDPESLGLVRDYTYPTTDVFAQRVLNNFRLKINLLLDVMGLAYSSATYEDLGQAILMRRSERGPFQSISDLERFLVDEDKSMTREACRRLCTNLCTDSWEDPDVCSPNPPDLYRASEAGKDVFRFTDVQSFGYELSPRSPVNINLASQEMIQVLLTGLTGFYLEEDPTRYDPQYRYNEFAWWRWTLSYFNDSAATYLPFRDINRSNSNAEARYGKIGKAEINASKAEEIAGLLYSRIHVDDNPYETWQEFQLHLRSLSDYYDSTKTPGTVACPLSKYQADLILAAANPNLDSNDINPNSVVFRYIDKNDLYQGPADADYDETQPAGFTTEFCFESTGVFGVESLGLVRRADGTTAGEYEVAVSAKLFDIVRLTTQEQFTKGFVDQSQLYSANNGILQTAGQGAAIMCETPLSLPPNTGYAWQSYPEPRRLKTKPDRTLVTPYQFDVSPYDGYLMLATLQADNFPLDPPSTSPTFRQSFNHYHYAASEVVPYVDEYGRSRNFVYHYQNLRSDISRFGGGDLLLSDHDHLPNCYDPYLLSSSPYTMGENPREGRLLNNLQRPEEPGNRYPDGGFSEGKESFSYLMYINMFGSQGMNGTVFFWVKPCWQPELAERERCFLNMSVAQKSNEPQAWWISSAVRANYQLQSVFTPDHTANVTPWHINNITEYQDRAAPHNIARRSFNFIGSGWSRNVHPYSMGEETWPGMIHLIGAVSQYSQVANRVGFNNAPAPDINVPDYKFRGREWNMIVHSWHMLNLTGYETQMAINGILADNETNSRTSWKGSGIQSLSTSVDHYIGDPLNLMINDEAMDYDSGGNYVFSPSWDYDPWFNSPGIEGGIFPMNGMLNTIRFGGQCHDPWGFSADSTYDEILCFTTGPIDPDGLYSGFDQPGLEGPYFEGRYYNMRDAVYTTPAVDLRKALNLPTGSDLNIVSVSYTAYWPTEVEYAAPRYDKPADPDYPLVPMVPTNTDDGGNPNDAPDPLNELLGVEYEDPIRLNLAASDSLGDTWRWDVADTTTWLTYAGGSTTHDAEGNPMRLTAGESLKVRVWMGGGDPGDPMYTSPVLDDISIVVGGFVKILRWEVRIP